MATSLNEPGTGPLQLQMPADAAAAGINLQEELGNLGYTEASMNIHAQQVSMLLILALWPSLI